jgi:hypothetical protein
VVLGAPHLLVGKLWAPPVALLRGLGSEWNWGGCKRRRRKGGAPGLGENGGAGDSAERLESAERGSRRTD